MTNAPVNLSQALAGFSDVYSPRIVGRVNDYDVRVAHVRGDHVWHVHEHTDEFFLVLDGRFEVSLRDDDSGERTVSLNAGDIFVVPKGTEHKPNSADGGAILMFEPSGTLTTGDRHEGEIPAYIDSTVGHDITGRNGLVLPGHGSHRRHQRSHVLRPARGGGVSGTVRAIEHLNHVFIETGGPRPP